MFLDLSYYASKVKYFNDLKKTLQDEQGEAVRLWGKKECSTTTTPPGTACSPNDLCCNIERLISTLQSQLQAIGDDAQLANTDFQNALQQQTQLTLSNIAKLMYDTTMSIIQNIRGDND